MYQAIGIIELKSIAQGVEATDAALKSAGVQLISAHAACPGKFEIILTGAINLLSFDIYIYRTLEVNHRSKHINVKESGK